jgi:hypothetical protein
MVEIRIRLYLKKHVGVTRSEIVDYTVAPIFMIDREKGAHDRMIEFKKKLTRHGVVSKVLDDTLVSEF